MIGFPDLRSIAILCGLSFTVVAQAPPTEPGKSPTPAVQAPTAEPKPEPKRRAELNLLGEVDSDAGESRRNENVHFNLIDNNALKELNIRLGITATIIDVFRVDHAYFGTEFGNPPSRPLHVLSRKVSSIHGNVHANHNNSVFSARSFFQVGPVKPARENNYGFAFAAPLWRGAALSLDAGQQKIRGSVNGNVLVPKADERTPLTTDPATRAIVQRYLAAYPAELPNRTDMNERALNTNAPQVVDGNHAQIRLEQQAGDRDRILSQYQFTSQHVDAFQFVAGQNPDTANKSHTAVLTWNRQWTARTLMDLSLGYDRLRSLLVPEPNAVGPLVLTAAVIEMLGPDETLPINRTENSFRAAGRVQHVRGPHSWTTGLEVRRRQINGSEQQAHRGIVYFGNDFGRNALTNIRMGTPSRYSVSLGDPYRGFRNWLLQFYAGDSWRVRPNFALEYGLRYQPVTRPVEVNGLSVIPYDCDCNNLAPQFGFAWNLPGRWGVWRAAYGLHYGEIFAVTFQQARFNPPQSISIVVPTPYLPEPLRGLTTADLGPNARTSLRLLSSELSTPYSHQYNFSWEPEIAKNWKLQIGYVGSRSPKLLMMWYTNRARPVGDIRSETINQRRPDQRYFDVYRVLNGSRGYFDAGKATLLLPSWHGISLDASYWFSKAIDLGSSYSNTAYDKDGRLSRSQFESPVIEDMKGLSPFDQTHSFLLRVAYAVPALAAQPGAWRGIAGRWNISMVLLRKTGTPFEVISGSDGPGFGNVDGQNGDRVHLLDPSILGNTVGDPDVSTERLPRSAFSFMRPSESRGNLGHHVFRKGGIANVNAAIWRVWTIAPEKTLTFRGESINFFNTPQFFEPGRELGSPNFGQITNTLNEGRTFRFTLRFGF